MSEQIQNFSTLNPFDDKMLEETSSTAAVTGKSGPSKIRKWFILLPFFSSGLKWW